MDIVFNKFRNQLLTGNDLWTSSTIYVLLVDSSSTFDPTDDSDNHLDEFFSEGGVELSTTNYTAGGQALTTKALVRDDTAHTVNLTADNLTWPALGVTGKILKAALVYLHTGTNSTSDLIAYFDSIGPLFLNGSNIVLVWGAQGVMSLQ